MINNKRWYFRLCIFLATCFGVFILPFLLPPPALAGISAANVAGFNNKVAALAAAALGAFVFFAALRTPHLKQERNDAGFGKLPRPLVLTATLLCGGMVAVLSYLIAICHQQYVDGGYFIRQISMHIDYGRKLYDQIEFTVWSAALLWASDSACTSVSAPCFHDSCILLDSCD